MDAVRRALAPTAPDRIAHLPTPSPETDDDDDEDDDDRGSGGGNIDPEEDEGWSDDDDDDEEEPLRAAGARFAAVPIGFRE